jgi:hypothetical protein
MAEKDETNTEVEDLEKTETDQGADDQDDDADEWTPPSKEDWEKVRNTAAARKADMAKLRKELGELKAKLGKGEQDEERQAEIAEAEREMKVKRLAGVAALTSEGLTKQQAKVAVRLLNLDDVEVDDDGDGDFEDAIAELKEVFPQLFAKESGGSGGGRTRAPRVATGNRGDGGGASKRDPEMTKLLQQAGLLKKAS